MSDSETPRADRRSYFDIVRDMTDDPQFLRDIDLAEFGTSEIPASQPKRLRELLAATGDRVRYSGYLVANSLNPDPDYTPPTFTVFREQRSRERNVDC